MTNYKEANEMTDIIIRVARDGNQICAIIGDMPEEVAVAFGNTADDALQELIRTIDLVSGICPVCWNEVEPIEQLHQLNYECNCGNKWEVAVEDL